MSNSLRIKTTPNSGDKYLKVKLEQDIDFIEILSLKITQEKAYQKFCSDYGVVVGRVIMNNGFGVPNSKVSIFVPLSTEDALNPEIRGLYPFTTISDKDSEGIRYNLLSKESDNSDNCYTPVGTFPEKREYLDNDKMLEVYGKYYKFTTTTNASGDFMIFGVPLGTHTVHVDVDISDIGMASQKPYDLIDQGVPTKMFQSTTKFKKNKNLNTLIQVKTANVGVNVQPFWGDLENCEIGISRVDIDLNYSLRPAAIFMGSIFGDNDKNSISKNCRPRKKMGNLCETETGGGTIEMIRKNLNGEIEEYGIESIDEDGTWTYQIPMNLDYMVTDELGNLIPSNDENRGIPTRSRLRFRIGINDAGGSGRLRTRAKYLVPHNPKQFVDRDFNFDKTTKDISFVDFYWNKIYSVKNFIARVQTGGGVDRRSIIGIKDIASCEANKTPFPYNRIDTNFNPLFSHVCILLNIIANFVSLINNFICFLRGIKIPIINKRPFGGLNPIELACPTEPPRKYTPGCKREKAEAFVDCVLAVIAEDLNLYTLDFYNDWINGTLYAFSLKYKKKRKGDEKFCEYDCNKFPNSVHNNKCNSNILLDSCTGTGRDAGNSFRKINILDGYISSNKKTLYYSPIVHIGTFKLFATDIINLGSVFDYDWQGTPKLQEYLLPTTFQVPPVVTEEDGDQTNCGMINVTRRNSENGVFFDINCKGLVVNEKNCNNIKKICELGVDLPSSNPLEVDCTVDRGEIYDPNDPVDTRNSINRFMRNLFYGLNINGANSSFLLPSNIDRDADGTSWDTGNPNSPRQGKAYGKFRNYFPIGNSYQQPLGNSYYFYFGIIAGRTSLHKLNTKYFATCEKAITDDYVIDTQITNTSLDGLKDGKITFTFVGGSGPFTYSWKGFNYTSGPTTSLTGGILTGLASGEYTITAIDLAGNTVIKTVTVSGPPSLTCFVVSIQDSTSDSSNDGKVQIIRLFGGKSPYNLLHTKPDGTFLNISVNQGDIISNVPKGLNNFLITDSANPKNECRSEVTIQAPLPLSINLDGSTPTSCNSSVNGYIQIRIEGGVPPYTILTTGPNNYSESNSTQSDLLKGIYKITVKDSVPTTVVRTYEVKQGTNPSATISKVTNGATHTYTVIVTGGSPPYTVEPTVGIPEYIGNSPAIFITTVSPLTVNISDGFGCEGTPVTSQ